MKRASTKARPGGSRIVRLQWPKAAWRGSRQPLITIPRRTPVDPYYPPEKPDPFIGLGGLWKKAEAIESEMAAKKRREEAARQKAIAALRRIRGGLNQLVASAQFTNQILAKMAAAFKSTQIIMPNAIPEDFVKKVTTYPYRCEKCGKRPRADIFIQPDNRRVVMQFDCHEERDQWEISEAILYAPRAFEKIKPFSRISPQTKKLEKPIKREEKPDAIDLAIDMARLEEDKSVRRKTKESRIGDFRRDDTGRIIGVITNIEIITTRDINGRETGDFRSPVISPVATLNDNGIVSGNPTPGTILLDKLNNVIGKVVVARGGRVSVRFNLIGGGPSQTVGEYWTEEGPSIISSPANPEITIKWQGVRVEAINEETRIGGEPVPPSIIYWYAGESITINTTGMTLEKYKRVKETMDRDPRLIMELYRAGLLNTMPTKDSTSTSGKKFINPPEREGRAINLTED